MKTVFVVLHYCLPDTTTECLDSLLSLEGEKEVVVVDNASPDGSGKALEKKYNDEKRVHVILSDNNGGFAYGNNLGFTYAKDKLKPDFIVVLNNDTLIKDKGFLMKLYKDGSSPNYQIIAPDILTFKGYHQNPYRKKGLTKSQVTQTLLRKKMSLLFYSIPFLYKTKSRVEVHRTSSYIFENLDDIVPHGAAVIFSRSWIENEDFAFYPGTFMYYEEDLLYLYAKSKNYKILYKPTLQIIHLEDMSTNHVHKNYRKSVVFQNKNKIKSLKIILNFMNKANMQGN